MSGRGQLLDAGQRSSTEVFGSFSPSGQALLAETAVGLMTVIVTVRQAWLRQQHPTDSIPLPVTHTMGGFARDVARRFSPRGLTYSHIAHMETLLRVDRFFGVSLLLLQQTEVSFWVAFILAGSVATTFDLFTHEWSRNPVRVSAAQEARRLAGRASAAASAAQTSSLGAFSRMTGRPDGMGMNIAGGYQKVQKDAAPLDITAAHKIEADHFLAAMGGSDATALASRGKSIPNRGRTTRNEVVMKLGEEIGSSVMGQETWAQYITTSIKRMLPQDKPFPCNPTHQLAKTRSPGERDGWVLHHADVTVLRWCMTDMITYRLSDHTEENPQLRMETFQAAISEAYHRNWE